MPGASSCTTDSFPVAAEAHDTHISAAGVAMHAVHAAALMRLQVAGKGDRATTFQPSFAAAAMQRREEEGRHTGGVGSRLAACSR